MQHARALSTATASWTQIGMATSYVPMIYGTEGTLLAQYQDNTLKLATNEHKHGELLDVPPLPAGQRNATEFFLSHLRSGTPITGLCGPDVGLMTQEVLEAGLISAAEGRAVSLPLSVERLQF
jgi:predicted dehydrogenase